MCAQMVCWPFLRGRLSDSNVSETRLSLPCDSPRWLDLKSEINSMTKGLKQSVCVCTGCWGDRGKGGSRWVCIKGNDHTGRHRVLVHVIKSRSCCSLVLCSFALSTAALMARNNSERLDLVMRRRGSMSVVLLRSPARVLLSSRQQNNKNPS